MTHETPEDKDFMAQHIKALKKEIETLTHRNEQLKDLIKSEQRLSEVLEKRGDEWKRRAGARQARIDALMFEFCPDDMTADQIAEYEKQQRKVEE